MYNETWLNELIDRIVTITQETIDNAGIKANVADSWPYQQDVFPYITVRLTSNEVDPMSEDIQGTTERVAIRIVAGHLTAGAKGEKTRQAYRLLPVLIEAFESNRMLVADAVDFNEEPTWLDSPGIEILPHSGLVVFVQGGIGSMQVGIEFGLSVPVIRE